MTDLIIEKLQVVEVKADAKHFVMIQVLDGYSLDTEGEADVIADIKDAFVALGCLRANVAVVIMQGLEIVQAEQRGLKLVGANRDG